MATEGGKALNATRKVMVIADPNRESAAALQYALSHAILDNDSLMLLHVSNNNVKPKHPFPFFKKSGSSINHNSQTSISSLKTERTSSDSGRHFSGGSIDLTFLEDMKKACKKVQPQIEVTTEVVAMDGKDKANVILSQCSEHGIDLLIIGQRRTLSTAILGKQKKNAPIKGDTAEYLIENSKCTCVAVHKKGANAGYLLNTKTQRDFWLLA
ncbi:Usp domain-containing protein [Heracleum sosnowskyi]|uniref:Usp domain-containing protein n=1 Tax=Heracleum sosnowskyi TaxID=360622 RepID=A0AAD8I954_9APIA|nr:Usp domain-containing protein [Heracleum sosnowskyi]